HTRSKRDWSSDVCSSDLLAVTQPPPYVGRGGIKLAHALDNFAIRPSGWACLDVGASTGGFTDCMLQRGAREVCAVDVGHGQLDRSEERRVGKEWRSRGAA